MNNYIEANHAKIEEALKQLKRQHLSQDIATFIDQFNHGIINTRNDSVKNIAKLLELGYANISTQGNKIVVKSTAETLISQSRELLNQYELIAVLKRISKGLIDSDYPYSTKLILSNEKPGFIYLEPEVEDLTVQGDQKHDYKLEDLTLYKDAERFTASKHEVPNNLFLRPFIHDYNTDENTCYLIAGEISKVSVNPVLGLQKFIDDTKKEISNRA